MIYLYPEQLTLQLSDKLSACYMIFGNDPFWVQKSVNEIRQIAKQKGFIESYSYSLDKYTNWESIYHLTQSESLFANKRILILILPQKGITVIITEGLFKLANLLHPNLLLILCGSKLTKIQKNSSWYKIIDKEDTVYVNCLTPERSKLTQWVTQRAKTMSITIDKQASQLLSYCYEGNLLALDQTLKRLSLLYPNGNLTLSHIKEAVNNAANFSPYHWIDALFDGKIKRSWRILQQLRREDCEAIVLLRIIQDELLLLLKFKQQNNNKNLKKIFDQYKIQQSRRYFISTALERLSLSRLQHAIQLTTQAELHLKQEDGYFIWLKLEALSALLCCKALPEIFI